MLFCITSSIVLRITVVGKFGGSSFWYWENQFLSVCILWSISMLVYIDIASHVNIRVLGGIEIFVSCCS